MEVIATVEEMVKDRKVIIFKTRRYSYIYLLFVFIRVYVLHVHVIKSINVFMNINIHTYIKLYIGGNILEV